MVAIRRGTLAARLILMLAAVILVPACGTESGYDFDIGRAIGMQISAAIAQSMYPPSTSSSAKSTPASDADVSSGLSAEPLVILSPFQDDRCCTNANPVILEIKLPEDLSLVTVTWTNTATGEKGTASGASPWWALVPLAKGENRITVSAAGTPSYFQTGEITLVYDPLVVVDIETPTFQSTYSAAQHLLELGGIALGTFGLERITWVNATTGNSGEAIGTHLWHAWIPVIPGENVLIITARDADGREGVDSITVTAMDGTFDGGPLR